MEWDFINNVVNSYYGWKDGTLCQIDIAQDFKATGTILSGWGFSLAHDSDTGHGGDVAYIDNLSIFGSTIYDSFGFDDFEYGALQGQENSYGDRWDAGMSTVPVPAAVWLLGTGLLGLLGLRRK